MKDGNRATGPAVVWPSIAGGALPVRRILVVQTQRLGDVLCATPLFTALRRCFPSAEITALVQVPFHEVLDGNPDLDAVLPYDGRAARRSLLSPLRLARELARRRFDWALSVHAAARVALALALARIPWRTCVWRYGPSRRPHWAGLFHQHLRQERAAGDRHEVDYNLDLLRLLDLEAAHEGIRVVLRPEETEAAREWLRRRGRDVSRPLAVLHPGHGGGRQVWPEAHYAALAEGLIARGFQVALTGSAAERPTVERIASTVRPAAVPSLLPCAGELDLRRLAAVLREAALFVSVPTGPMHLAAAFRVPIVALYGPADLAVDLTRFHPYGTRYRAVCSPVACACPGSRVCRDPICLRAIEPERVLAAAEELGAL